MQDDIAFCVKSTTIHDAANPWANQQRVGEGTRQETMRVEHESVRLGPGDMLVVEPTGLCGTEHGDTLGQRG